MKELEIKELIDQCLKFFQENNYTSGRIKVYESLWRNGIIKFMSSRGENLYNESVGADFIETCVYEGTVRHQEREKIRSVKVLDDMLNLGYIRKRCHEPVEHVLDGEIGESMLIFIRHLEGLRRSATTIRDYKLYLSEFLQHLNAMGVYHVKDIGENHVVAHLASLSVSQVSVTSAIRNLFRFWHETLVIDHDFSQLLKCFQFSKKTRIPSFYSREEVLEIERSISRSDASGKRNYAMFLLASRLGLRVSDIVSLKFENLDWDESRITLVMRKTKKVIRLPLLADVGNAIIDYLKNARPSSDSKQVFLSTRAPYTGATKEMVCEAINGIIMKSGVDVNLRHHGPHSLRHSLATAMMGHETPLPVISEALGHKSAQTTMIYLKTDIAGLKKCAMPVPPVEDNFYTQRGGAFYE
jgi:site-specific recombinase XerD